MRKDNIGLCALGLGVRMARYGHCDLVRGFEAAGYERVMTHIFTPNCPYLVEDALFGAKRSLVAEFRHVEDLELAATAAFSARFWEVGAADLPARML